MVLLAPTRLDAPEAREKMHWSVPDLLWSAVVAVSVMPAAASATADSMDSTVHSFNVFRPVHPRECARMEHANVLWDSVAQPAVMSIAFLSALSTESVGMGSVSATRVTRERVANRKSAPESPDVVVKIMVSVTTALELASVLETGPVLIVPNTMLHARNLARIAVLVSTEPVPVLPVGAESIVPKLFLALTRVKEVRCGPKMPPPYFVRVRTSTSLSQTYPEMHAARALLKPQSGTSPLVRVFLNPCVDHLLVVSCPSLLPTRWS